VLVCQFENENGLLLSDTLYDGWDARFPPNYTLFFFRCPFDKLLEKGFANPQNEFCLKSLANSMVVGYHLLIKQQTFDRGLFLHLTAELNRTS